MNPFLQKFLQKFCTKKDSRRNYKRQQQVIKLLFFGDYFQVLSKKLKKSGRNWCEIMLHATLEVDEEFLKAKLIIIIEKIVVLGMFWAAWNDWEAVIKLNKTNGNNIVMSIYNYFLLANPVFSAYLCVTPNFLVLWTFLTRQRFDST